ARFCYHGYVDLQCPVFLDNPALISSAGRKLAGQSFRNILRNGSFGSNGLGSKQRQAPAQDELKPRAGSLRGKHRDQYQRGVKRSTDDACFVSDACQHNAGPHRALVATARLMTSSPLKPAKAAPSATASSFNTHAPRRNVSSMEKEKVLSKIKL